MSAESTAIETASEASWGYLGEPRRRLLTASWAGLFRHQLLVRFPVTTFATQFPKSGGRPRKDLRLILGVLILQQLHDLTEAETVEAVAFNLAWHYALGLSPTDPIYLCERTLRNYRRAVISQGLEGALFSLLTDGLIRVSRIETAHQRIDSTVVCSAMRVLTRVGILVETMSKFLRELKRGSLLSMPASILSSCASLSNGVARDVLRSGSRARSSTGFPKRRQHSGPSL